jgi:hypothetical protein
MSEDATYVWRLRAVSQATALGIPLELVGEAVGILTTVFGGEWLDEKCRKLDRGTVFGDCLATGPKTTLAVLHPFVTHPLLVA